MSFSNIRIGRMKVKQQVKRLAFVSTMAGAPWGGSEELWSQTALRLRASGHHVVASVVKWPFTHSRLREMGDMGVGVLFRKARTSRAMRLLRRCFSTNSIQRLDRVSVDWLRREAPDLVVISQGYTWDGLVWMLACMELRIRYRVIIHANYEGWWPTDVELPLIRKALGGAEVIYCVSHANWELLGMQCGLLLHNAKIVVNPWKVDSTAPVAWPADTGMVEIACVGRLDPRAKGQDVLFCLLAQAKWRERPIRLNVYGEGPCEGSLRALVTLLGLANVRFHGHISDVKSIWEVNHALVLPSRFEGLPLVIIEAMICGRMVVTTNVAGNAEYIVDGTHGFVAAGPCVESLDEALERAWSHRSQWVEMGMRSRAHVMRQLPRDPIAVFANELLESY